jgi:hypothetical protein
MKSADFKFDYYWAYRSAIAEAFPPIEDQIDLLASRLMGGSTPSVSFGLDPGIRAYVERLQESGIETFESCEGGPGHAYPEPTVRFYGTPEAGWRAVGICLAYGLPIQFLRRIWYVLDRNEPSGPYWEIVFRVRC